MKKKLFGIALALAFCFVLVAPVALAQLNIESNLNITGEGIYGPGAAKAKPLPVMIGGIINVVLGFLGILLVVYFVWGGFKYMSAGSDPASVTKAKDMLKNAVIGLFITLAAYSISSFVISSILKATNTP